jgi:hypothetical protein
MCEYMKTYFFSCGLHLSVTNWAFSIGFSIQD